MNYNMYKDVTKAYEKLYQTVSTFTKYHFSILFLVRICFFSVYSLINSFFCFVLITFLFICLRVSIKKYVSSIYTIKFFLHNCYDFSCLLLPILFQLSTLSCPSDFIYYSLTFLLLSRLVFLLFLDFILPLFLYILHFYLFLSSVIKCSSIM